jgi:malate synthase
LDAISVKGKRHSAPSTDTSPRTAHYRQSPNSLPADGIETDLFPSQEFAQLLSPGAVSFIASLHRRFSTRRLALLQRRVTIQSRINSGTMPSFSPATAEIRDGSWRIAPVPPDLEDRRVEITGPAGDPKMVINALNSGANVFMADFEDAQSPTWENVLQGQLNLYRAIRRTISHVSPEGRQYKLHSEIAVLMMRPRGWHLAEPHFRVDGQPVSASLFDFGLYFYHNARELSARGTGPYIYLPKLENHLEARLWNDVFVFAEEQCGVPAGTIKATVLIETILAAFEMDEILFELREHSAGLNCGRWDYIFSVIKKFNRNPDFILPDRAQVTMEKGFLASYVTLLIATCHKRGAHAMGGMAAQIPNNSDPVANELALAKVRADKMREVHAGHDGTWVAHPALVPVAKAVFDEGFKGKNQLDVIPQNTGVTGEELLRVTKGEVTEAGVRTNIDVGIQYLEAWLRGFGAVPLYHLMEDTATAEISRAQLWQWIHHGVEMSSGVRVTLEEVRRLMDEEIGHIRERIGEERYAAGKYDLATAIFDALIAKKEFEDFLTLAAYEHIS